MKNLSWDAFRAYVRASQQELVTEYQKIATKRTGLAGKEAEVVASITLHKDFLRALGTPEELICQ